MYIQRKFTLENEPDPLDKRSLMHSFSHPMLLPKGNGLVLIDQERGGNVEMGYAMKRSRLGRLI